MVDPLRALIFAAGVALAASQETPVCASPSFTLNRSILFSIWQRDVHLSLGARLSWIGEVADVL
jgi:hypothetical protein